MRYRTVAVLITFGAVLFMAACGSNGGESDADLTSVVATQPAGMSGVCGGAIPALTTNPVTRERLQATVEKLREVRRAAESGDAAAASAAFAGDAHAVTHDIDEPLRDADPLLAADLCESIVIIEREFGGQADLQAVAAAAEASAGLLEESGRALGLSE